MPCAHTPARQICARFGLVSGGLEGKSEGAAMPGTRLGENGVDNFYSIRYRIEDKNSAKIIFTDLSLLKYQIYI